MTTMTREDTEAAILDAEVEYGKTCKSNAKLLLPARAEVKRLNAVARKAKDGKVKVLKAWLAVIDTGAVPKEPDAENKTED